MGLEEYLNHLAAYKNNNERQIINIMLRNYSTNPAGWTVIQLSRQLDVDRASMQRYLYALIDKNILKRVPVCSKSHTRVGNSFMYQLQSDYKSQLESLLRLKNPAECQVSEAE